MKIEIVNISVIIPTYNRKQILINTLDSLANQYTQPFEIIIIDGSTTFEELKQSYFHGLKSNIIHKKAIELGAAKQRNQGVDLALTNIIGFFDDDIILEKDCIKRLFEAITGEGVGGVNAMIVNQKYQSPGTISSVFYRIISGLKTNDFAGKCIGPAINFLPSDTGGDINKVEWLNTTCTLYRKELLPIPVFPAHLKGYSLMEDLTLSLQVAKKANLYNVRIARIFHDTQISSSKHTDAELAEMDLVNRYYIMKNILHKSGAINLTKLAIQQLFSMMGMLSSPSKLKKIPQTLVGKYRGIKEIL